MPKAKQRFDQKQTVLYGALIILATVCGLFLFLLVYGADNTAPKETSYVSVGALRYKIVNEKAVLRDDASVKSLQAFLENEAAKSGCPADAPGYERVAAATKDETQVLVKYGCGAGDSPIYGVKVDGAWKMISPTNHFDGYDIPDCGYLDKNDISKEIAPVCSNNITTSEPVGDPEYVAR